MTTEALAAAERVVRGARLRMQTARAARRGAAALLAGAAASLVALGLGTYLLPGGVDGALTGTFATALIALPVAAALAATAAVIARPPSVGSVALALDARARTDEAFVSALTATDARIELRSLAARYALERCPHARLRDVLPLQPPPAAPAAAVVFVLLLVAVALAAAPGPGGRANDAAPPSRGVVSGATAGAGMAAEPVPGPADRVAALADALRRRESAAPVSAAAAERAMGDLAAIGDEELDALARALQRHAEETGAADRADLARRALEALAAGDRAAATAALLRGLGPAPGVLGAGSGALAGAADGIADPAGEVRATSARTWPLCYDRRVRRWFEATAPRGTSRQSADPGAGSSGGRDGEQEGQDR